MKAWSTAGGILSVPGDLVGRYRTGEPEVDTFNKLCLQLIHRRLLPRRFWYYVKWGYRAHKYLNQCSTAQMYRFGAVGYMQGKFGDWDIFKEVMED